MKIYRVRYGYTGVHRVSGFPKLGVPEKAI